MASLQAFPSLPPRAPLAFLSRKIPIPFPFPLKSLPRRLMPKLKGSPEWEYLQYEATYH